VRKPEESLTGAIKGEEPESWQKVFGIDAWGLTPPLKASRELRNSQQINLVDCETLWHLRTID